MRNKFRIPWCMLSFVIASLFLSFNVWAQVSTARPLVLRTDSAYSPALGRMKSFTVLLPTAYDSTMAYPVLYLLHGFGGSHRDWSMRTELVQYVGRFPTPLIVVMPDGENSWYVNSLTNPRDRFEDYIANEIPQAVQKKLQGKYRIDTTRQAIAGLSMGGYGATMLALRYPDRFRCVGAFSAVLTVPRDLVPVATGVNIVANPTAIFVIPSLFAAFGGSTTSPVSENERAFRTDHDVFALLVAHQAKQQAKKISPEALPYIYLAVGIQDRLRLLPGNAEFANLLRVAAFRYEYHELPGGHDWKFWDASLQSFLQRLQKVFQP